MDRPRVAILGAGLSSAYAILAAIDYGCDRIDLYSDQPGFPPLIAHLRWAPEWLGMELEPIVRIGLGNREDYMRKLDRPRWDIRTNYPARNGIEIEYGISPMKFFKRIYKPDPVQNPLNYQYGKALSGKLSDNDVIVIAKEYDYVFQSFPTEEALHRQPPYRYYTMLISETQQPAYPNVIIYNGLLNVTWTRFAMMWGYTTWEFSSANGKVLFDKTGYKEISLKDFGLGTNPYLTTPASNVHLIGRWARWDKKALSHDTYDQVYDTLFTAGGK